MAERVTTQLIADRAATSMESDAVHFAPPLKIDRIVTHPNVTVTVRDGVLSVRPSEMPRDVPVLGSAPLQSETGVRVEYGSPAGPAPVAPCADEPVVEWTGFMVGPSPGAIEMSIVCDPERFGEPLRPDPHRDSLIFDPVTRKFE